MSPFVVIGMVPVSLLGYPWTFRWFVHPVLVRSIGLAHGLAPTDAAELRVGPRKARIHDQLAAAAPARQSPLPAEGALERSGGEDAPHINTGVPHAGEERLALGEEFVDADLVRFFCVFFKCGCHLSLVVGCCF